MGESWRTAMKKKSCKICCGVCWVAKRIGKPFATHPSGGSFVEFDYIIVSFVVLFSLHKFVQWWSSEGWKMLWKIHAKLFQRFALIQTSPAPSYIMQREVYSSSFLCFIANFSYFYGNIR
jgi:hypothetical protein